jgi:sorbitol-6-phosphate 2-dehydrogenase
MKKKSLKDKVAIVTGGGRGLGEALCHGMAKEGALVIPWDIDRVSVQKSANTLHRINPAAGLYHTIDITSEDEVKKAVNDVLAAYGKIDILIANAGILESHEITEFPANAWRKVLEVNLVGYFLCAKYVAIPMKRQRYGTIIQINSKSGKKGSYKNSAYAASKFGGIGLTQSIALELAEYGIRVNAVCPGNLLDSPLWQESLFEQYAKKWGITPEEVRKKYLDQVPMQRPCTYQDVLNVVLFLASDSAGYMTGQAINVTGGQEMR